MRNVASYRMRRVNEAIKRLSEQLFPGAQRSPHGFVTLTGVDTAPDLSHAKVFVSVYGKQEEKDTTLEGLRAARPYLQRLISDELTIKRTPMLEFVYDTSVDRGMRIQALLKSGGAGELGPEHEEALEISGEDVVGRQSGDRGDSSAGEASE
jgi:ribosome-binding factor A